jgi:methylmalonyl-CoA decarboxylase
VISCDLVVASQEATFAITPAKLGVPYNLSGVLNFVRAASLLFIKEALFTGQPITAERATLAGFVNHVVPSKDLEQVTYRLATQIADNSPLVISVLKEQLRVISEAAPLNPEGFERVQALRRAVYDSTDYKEGIRAFLEKRTPKFVGR